ncbi:hypothetical protein C162_03889 [Paenibacillus sp. FSL R7-269]|uniref:hypothetical protein n=1 Tax=Paenibacillus sp. FSL R7-269 TaxID=1226755 RepID=UPI0003E1EEBD|nr:hypothetical protein [Paenibacillus sp. FSL R7-269]ETT54810.1 hypothetical protein C162_03889 [Paenibacillus sp. FSL R7-269]
MQIIIPIELLDTETKRKIYEVQGKLKNETAELSDIGVIMNVVQKYPNALNSYGITLVARIAEVHFKHPEYVDYDYTLENLNAAFGLV